MFGTRLATIGGSQTSTSGPAPTSLSHPPAARTPPAATTGAAAGLRRDTVLRDRMHAVRAHGYGNNLIVTITPTVCFRWIHSGNLWDGVWACLAQASLDAEKLGLNGDQMESMREQPSATRPGPWRGRAVTSVVLHGTWSPGDQSSGRSKPSRALISAATGDSLPPDGSIRHPRIGSVTSNTEPVESPPEPVRLRLFQQRPNCRTHRFGRNGRRRPGCSARSGSGGGRGRGPARCR